MPLSVSFLLESLVTTLLLLDHHMHQHLQTAQAEPPLLYKQHSAAFQATCIPSRCRSRSSNSLSSSSSSESEAETLSPTAVMAASAAAATTTGESASLSPTAPGGASYQYHCPPQFASTASSSDNNNANSNNANYYDSNDTVFGSILRGQLPAVTLAESDRLVALQDISPRAPLHALIIPKAYIGSIFDVASSQNEAGEDDMEWMMEMQDMALQLIETHHPEAYAMGDYRLAFHIPPFNSVNHLHLHVFAPLSQLPWYYRHIKYNTNMRWCISLQQVMERLDAGQTSVPYRRPPTCHKQQEPLPTNSKSQSSCGSVLVPTSNNNTT